MRQKRNNMKSTRWLLLMTLPLMLFIGSKNCFAETKAAEGLPLYYWQHPHFTNFGDYLSLKLVERIVGKPVKIIKENPQSKVKKFLAVGSIISFAKNNDVVWGSGVNGKNLNPKNYKFSKLDIRSVRGPLTKDFLNQHLNIKCPEVYGDPVLLFPYFFPEFKKSENPKYDYIIIPHYSEKSFFPRTLSGNIVYPTDPWQQIIKKVINSKFVISSSLHGVIIAEAFGIPARLLKITDNEPIFKFADYYLGTNRPNFQYATSVEEALLMGGEPPFECDLQKLYEAFPFEFWPNSEFIVPDFAKL